jgi:pimeloyl-ACP methyl ester carboxylesterase
VTINREFVSLPSEQGRAGAGGRQCQGLYHRPSTGAAPKTALIATHYDVDFSEHYLAEYMAERGYGFLGWNTRYRGLGSYFSLDNAVTDIGLGVDWLRTQAGAETVVILGNSGGASLMSAWQSHAIDGAGGRPAELFVSLCAHPGRPDVFTMWLDPSVADETDPIAVDLELDMFNPDHGPPYPRDFVARYRDAQVARNDRITAWAKAELDRLAAAGSWDRVFNVYRSWADLRFLDLSLDPSDRETGCYFGDPKFANYGPFGLGMTNTCRSWLSMWSLSESNCRAAPHLRKVTQPALVVQSMGDKGCFPSDAQAIHDDLASTDKRLEFVPGDHYLQTPSTARDDVADLIAAWLKQQGA